MNVGDIKKHQIKGQIAEHIVTQEEVDEYNAQQLEIDKQTILTRLSELDKQLPQSVEEMYIINGYTMMVDMQAVHDEKCQLKSNYTRLTSEILPCCIDTDKLNNLQTTRIDFGDAIIDLLIELETVKSDVNTLKGGV